jgi:hypothetical protein
MSYADALDSEEAWFTSSVAGLPALLEPAGPFDVVSAGIKRLSQAPRQLFLGHGPTTDRRQSKDSDRRVDHEIVALIFWPSTVASTRADEDQEALDDAVDKVLQRVRGPADDDSTHGGRWWHVGDARVEPPNPATILAFADVQGAVGRGYSVAVRYSVTEWA